MSDSLSNVENDFKMTVETVAAMEAKDLLEVQNAASKLEQDGSDKKPTVQDETDGAVDANDRVLENLTVSSNGRNGDELPAPEVTVIVAVKTELDEIVVNPDEKKTLENGTEKCARKIEVDEKEAPAAVGEKDDGYVGTSSPSPVVEVSDNGAQDSGNLASAGSEMKMEVDVVTEEVDGAAKTEQKEADAVRCRKETLEIIPEGEESEQDLVCVTPEKNKNKDEEESKGRKRGRTATPKKKAKIEGQQLRRSPRQRQSS